MTSTAMVPGPSAIERDEGAIRAPWRMALRRFMRNWPAVGGLVVLVLLVVVCFGSMPWCTDRLDEKGNPIATGGAGGAAGGVARYSFQDLEKAKAKPGEGFWMGRDALGRDLRARFFLGGVVSLTIGICSALIAVIIGTTVGLLAGYLGGRVDAVLMRLVDVLYGLPYILLVVLMRVALVPIMQDFLEGKDWIAIVRLDGATAGMWANFLVLLFGIGSVSWLTLSRVVRGQVLSLREQPFVESARAMGFRWPRIMGRHILPNLVGTIVVYGTLTVPAAILSESFLSFLGLGIQAPLPSWGNLASDGMEALNPVRVRWWMIAWPCVGLSVALLALNFVGDGVRDAVDPKG